MPEALITFILFFFVFVVLAINIISLFQTKGSLLKVAGLIIVFTIFFTGSSIFWTKDVAYDTETIKHLEFGWPVPFDIQNQERFDPPFPFSMGSAREVPSDFLWNNFFGSVVINAVLWGAGLFSLALFFRKAGIVVRPLTFKVTLITIVTLIIVVISASFIYLKILEWRNPGINSPVVPLGGGTQLLPVPSIR